jgi:hypothetical protein
MPCYDGGYNTSSLSSEIDDLKDTIDKRNAMLCAIFSAASKIPGGVDGMLDQLDYKECGITRNYMCMWWNEHQEADRIRKERELAESVRRAEEKVRKEARKALVAQLTPEQRTLLGVK